MIDELSGSLLRKCEQQTDTAIQKYNKIQRSVVEKRDNTMRTMILKGCAECDEQLLMVMEILWCVAKR